MFRVVISGPKRRINFKILPLHYDADAQYGAVFLCGHKTKLHKTNSHLLKYSLLPSQSGEVWSFWVFWTCWGELSFVLFHRILPRDKQTEKYIILYWKIKKIPLQFSHILLFWHKGCKRKQIKLKFALQPRFPGSFLCSILRGNS